MDVAGEQHDEHSVMHLPQLEQEIGKVATAFVHPLVRGDLQCPENYA